MSIGEAKSKRAKKEMIEANLRLVYQLQKIYTTEDSISRFNSRRKHWFNEGGR